MPADKASAVHSWSLWAPCLEQCVGRQTPEGCSVTQSPHWQKLVVPIDLNFVEKRPSSVVVKTRDPAGTDVLVQRLLVARVAPAAGRLCVRKPPGDSGLCVTKLRICQLRATRCEYSETIVCPSECWGPAGMGGVLASCAPRVSSPLVKMAASSSPFHVVVVTDTMLCTLPLAVFRRL